MKILLFTVCVSLFSSYALAKHALTDMQVKQQIVKESVAAYPGNCACPYNSDRAGRSCGRRSAYSKPGGRAPLCYEDDVTDKMANEWRKRHQ